MRGIAARTLSAPGDLYRLHGWARPLPRRQRPCSWDGVVRDGVQPADLALPGPQVVIRIWPSPKPLEARHGAGIGVCRVLPCFTVAEVMIEVRQPSAL
jgi:hypothetical protein